MLDVWVCRRIAALVEFYTSSLIILNRFMIYVTFLIERLNEVNYYRCGLT
jgi:hypothetical protein